MIGIEVSLTQVSDELYGFNKAFTELSLVCEKLRHLVNDSNEFESWLGSVNTNILVTKNFAIRYIINSKVTSSHHSLNPKTSSNRSRTSFISKKMFNKATELASLEKELAFADK